MNFALNLMIIIADELMLFGVNLMVARHVGEKLFGDYSVATHGLVLFATITTLGMDSVIAYYFPKLYSQGKYSHIALLANSFRQFIQPIYLFVFTISILLMVTLVGLASAFQNISFYEIHHPLFLFLWGTLAISLYKIYMQYLRSINYMRTAVLMSFLQTFIFFALTLLLYHQVENWMPDLSKLYIPHMMLLIFVSSYFIVTVASYFYVKGSRFHDNTETKPVDVGFTEYQWREKIYGYMIQNLNAYIFTTTPLLIMEWVGNNEKSVGMFSAVISIVSLAAIAITPIAILISPDISAALGESKQQLKAVMRKYLMICFSLGLVIALVFVALAKPILTLYQSQFIDALPFLYVSLLTIMTYALSMPVSKMVQFSKSGSTVGARLTLWLVCSQVVSSLVLIKFFDLYGAIFCYVGMNIAYCIIMFIMSYKIYREHDADSH